MIELRDTPAASRFLDLLWAEAQRQQSALVAPPQQKEREAVISRSAQHAN